MARIRLCFRVSLCVCMVFMLVGCMQALQTNSGADAQPLPSPPALTLTPEGQMVSLDGTPTMMVVVSTTTHPEVQTSAATPLGATLYPTEASPIVATESIGVPSTDTPIATASVQVSETPSFIPFATPTQTTTPLPTPTVSPGSTSPVAPFVSTGMPDATATLSQPQQSQTPTIRVEPPTLVRLTPEERWRTQQLNRTPFESPRLYTTTGSELWWYDPINQQHVILGSFSGTFTAQARFTLRGQGMPALEVPYEVNVSYGLTAISSALEQRIKAAGYDEWIETYVFVTSDVQSE